MIKDNDMKKVGESPKSDAEKDLLNGRSSFVRKLLEAWFLLLNFGIAMVKRMFVFYNIPARHNFG